MLLKVVSIAYGKFYLTKKSFADFIQTPFKVLSSPVLLSAKPCISSHEPESRVQRNNPGFVHKIFLKFITFL